jgi:hypothetical protein
MGIIEPFEKSVVEMDLIEVAEFVDRYRGRSCSFGQSFRISAVLAGGPQAWSAQYRAGPPSTR